MKNYQDLFRALILQFHAMKNKTNKVEFESLCFSAMDEFCNEFDLDTTHNEINLNELVRFFSLAQQFEA